MYRQRQNLWECNDFSQHVYLLVFPGMNLISFIFLLSLHLENGTKTMCRMQIETHFKEKLNVF